jgi:glycosyltransferase involved in cell wall biosynthesis
MRVAVVGGLWPEDSSHLSALADHVDLVFHHSRWHPAGYGVEYAPQHRSGPPSRAHRPLVRVRTGHLGFVYPELHRVLTVQRPDVVHVFSEPWGLLAVQAARWVRAHPGARLALHGCDTMWHHGHPAKRLARRGVLALTMGTVDGFAAENSKALRTAQNSGLRPDALLARIHTNPRDAELWRVPSVTERASARAGLGLDTVAIGFSGRLVPEKGVLELLEAARRLHSTDFPARFFVAGSGPLSDQLSRLASPNVELLGSLQHPKGVLGLMRALDVFACPSLVTPHWEDQGPRSLIEAMMCGVLPVATATGGIPEMLDGHGILSEGPDAGSLADALVRASAAARDTTRGIEVADHATSVYSGGAVAARLLEFWSSLLSGKARPAGLAPSGGTTSGIRP